MRGPARLAGVGNGCVVVYLAYKIAVYTIFTVNQHRRFACSSPTHPVLCLLTLGGRLPDPGTQMRGMVTDGAWGACDIYIVYLN